MQTAVGPDPKKVSGPTYKKEDEVSLSLIFASSLLINSLSWGCWFWHNPITDSYFDQDNNPVNINGDRLDN